MDKDGEIRAFDRLGWTREELHKAQRAARKGERRKRYRHIYAGVIVWAGVFGLLWVFG